MGNRGCIHRGREIVRPWATRRWITCALEFKEWVAPKWVPGRWTALFFYDEALALAAGHRPCALCRREAYNRYREAIGMSAADDIDARLHVERLDGRRKRMHVLPWRSVPPGTYVEIAGVAHLALENCVRPWFRDGGYGGESLRPDKGDALVLTPPLSIRALANGYKPQIRD
jgi:hypothetical protein